MSEDIKLEDIHPELKESADEPKVLKKFQKMTDKLLGKVNGRINAERDILRKKLSSSSENIQANIDNFIKGTNGDLEKFKKRYEAMYTDLVRRILVKMENRVFNAEIFEQASLDLLVEKVYRLENNLKPEDELDEIAYQAYIEDCAKKHEGLMQKHVTEFAKRQKEAQNVEPVQKEKEDKTEDSGGVEDKSSDSSDQKDSGTPDGKDGGETESTPAEGQS